MYNLISTAFTHGLLHSPEPWCKRGKLRFLCPAPGYDRHFRITEFFGMELIPIAMTDEGPDMDAVLQWIKDNGGAEGMKKRNYEKAEMLYGYLDNNDFYHATAQKGSRSIMNVPFLTKYSTGATDEASVAKEKEINDKFVKEATAAGLVNLKGHRLVGGMRASIYNAMSLDGVKALIAFMKKFAEENK